VKLLLRHASIFGFDVSSTTDFNYPFQRKDTRKIEILSLLHLVQGVLRFPLPDSRTIIEDVKLPMFKATDKRLSLSAAHLPQRFLCS
jgi:hypothetical protein